MGDEGEGGRVPPRGQYALSHGHRVVGMVESARAAHSDIEYESSPLTSMESPRNRPQTSSTFGRIAGLVGASLARGGAQTGRAASAVAERLRQKTSAILSFSSNEPVASPARAKNLHEESPKLQDDNQSSTVDRPKHVVSNKKSLKPSTKTVDVTSVNNQLPNSVVQNTISSPIDVNTDISETFSQSNTSEKSAIGTSTKSDTSEIDYTETKPKPNTQKKEKSINRRSQKPLPKSEVSNNNAEVRNIKSDDHKTEISADKPDDVIQKEAHTTPQVLSQELHADNEKKIMNKNVTRGDPDVTSKSQGIDYQVVNTKDILEEKTRIIGSKAMCDNSEDCIPNVEEAMAGTPKLVALSGTDSSASSEDETSSEDEFAPSDACDCVEELRKYVDPPRVFIPDLRDYGDDQDQFISRRDCSKTSKRYLRCGDFWVSTCRPSEGDPPQEALEQWEKTCPPPQRRSLQACIRAKEAAHEEERKRVLAEHRKGQREGKEVQHLPTAPPRLCRSIYDECEPPLGPSPQPDLKKR